MICKSEQAAITGFLEDTSNLKNGWTPGVFFPETPEEVASLLASAAAEGRRYTIAGNGTGTIGARIPFGDYVIAMQKLDRIGEIEPMGDGRALLCVQPGALLQEV